MQDLQEVFEKLEKKGFVIVRKQYFEDMSKSFEELLSILVNNSPTDSCQAIRNLEYLRSGFDLKNAESKSKHAKQLFLSSLNEIGKTVESSTDGQRND